jgi:hypothetical protein
LLKKKIPSFAYANKLEKYFVSFGINRHLAKAFNKLRPRHFVLSFMRVYGALMRESSLKMNFLFSISILHRISVVSRFFYFVIILRPEKRVKSFFQPFF